MILAIDGHSSCGKSTTAKELAKRLGIAYVDTGAMYRAVTLFVLREGISLDDHTALTKLLDHLVLEFKNENGYNVLYANGEDINQEIRSLAVSNAVSNVAAIPLVRERMVALQRAMGTNSLVMDGRDIGSVVFPNADIKFFVTADVNERARRRHLELISDNQKVSFEEVLENLKLRDHIDSTRETSPLIQVADAILFDTTDFTLEEQNAAIYQIVLEKKKNSVDK
jgi:cytidylate kinase